MNTPAIDSPPAKATETLTLMVVDDSEAFRGAARSLVERLPGFDLVAETDSGGDAVARFADISPDLVLMDLRMPGVDGIEATRRIVDRWPSAVVVLITSEDAERVSRAAAECGAASVMQKEALRTSCAAEWRRLVLSRRMS